MKVTLRDVMGNDKTVVDAARVSFSKYKDTFDEQDEKLIRYLAKHNHWSPFSHPQISLHVSAPIFVLRQLLKSTVGLTWNEVSRRYVNSEPSVFIPETFRHWPENKKQGSGDDFSWVDNANATEVYHNAMHLALNFYKKLLELDVAPELARAVLPLAVYSEGIWTGSLAAFARVYTLRYAPDAQQETREIAKQIGDILIEKFPVSWRALIDRNSV